MKKCIQLLQHLQTVVMVVAAVEVQVSFYSHFIFDLKLESPSCMVTFLSHDGERIQASVAFEILCSTMASSTRPVVEY